VSGLPLLITIERLRGYEHLPHAHEGVLFLFSCLLGATFYLIISPPIYRLLRLRPVLVPKCPHCGQLPGRVEVIEVCGPRYVVICGKCNKKFEIWYVRPANKDVSTEVPSAYPSWPQSIGRWRLIEKKKDSS
jgi:hypothetical protein